MFPGSVATRYGFCVCAEMAPAVQVSLKWTMVNLVQHPRCGLRTVDVTSWTFYSVAVLVGSLYVSTLDTANPGNVADQWRLYVLD